MRSLAAFVLHRWDWSESSLILDLLTREQGRIAVAAKGAKRPHSNLRAVLLPFQRIAVTLGRAPEGDAEAEIRNLRAAEWAGSGAMLKGGSLFSGFYLNELLMKLDGRTASPMRATGTGRAILALRRPRPSGPAPPRPACRGADRG